MALEWLLHVNGLFSIFQTSYDLVITLNDVNDNDPFFRNIPTVASINEVGYRFADHLCKQAHKPASGKAG